jgi:tetratricopeptide (TPR) repeat protein
VFGIAAIAIVVVFIGTGHLPDLRSLTKSAPAQAGAKKPPSHPGPQRTTPVNSAPPPATAAAVPNPEQLPPEELKKAEQDPARMALALEHHVDSATCAQVVGPTWSLLNSDQPTRAMIEIHAGRKALMLGKLDQAELSFCRATVLDPLNPEAFISLTRLFLLQRDPKQAKEWAERGAKNHPDNVELRSLYGDALARLGEIDRAVVLWLESVKIDPADSTNVRGVAYTFALGGERALKGSDFAQADRLFRRAALLDPSNAAAAAGLARTLLVQEEGKAALAWAKRAAALDPRDGDIRLVLGDAQEKAGNMKDAYEAWKLAYELDAKSTRAYSRLQRIPPEMR